MCAHFNGVDILAYSIVICHFGVSIVEDNERWLLTKKIVY